MQLLHPNEWQQQLMPRCIVECILPVRWHPIHIEVKCELLYNGQDLLEGAADLRCRVDLPVQGFAIDTDTEFPNTPLFAVYGGTALVETDSSNNTSKLFSSTDEFGQVHKGKGDVEEKCETESLKKRGIDLSDEALEINVHSPEGEPPQGGQCHRWNRRR